MVWNKGLTKETDFRVAASAKANTGRIAWNKGLNKKSDKRVAKGAHSLSQSMKGTPGRTLSEETKLKLSIAQKLAHAEGRAWNIGMSRWNNEPSYPEKFFMKIIKNEFTDKNYKREVPFDLFSLDFNWFHKKKVIEIDVKQHDTDILQKQRDIEKDKLLREEGWDILRIKWKDMCRDTKKWIEVAKDFIET